MIQPARAFLRRPSLPFALGLLAAAGCGSLTAGGATGEAAVVVSGDAQDPVPSLAFLAGPSLASSAAPSAPAPTDHEDDDPEGQLEAEFSLFLIAEGGALVPLTDGDVEVRVDLEGLEEPEVAERVVEARRYQAIRMVFSEIQVQVDRGLIIDGVPITGPIDIEIETSLAVEKSVDIQIAGGQRVVLAIDLNAASWLQAVDPEAKTVDAQVFANLITVALR